MKRLLLTGFIALASLSLQSCTGCKNTNTPAPDNPYGLPNATQTGANMFACRINGQNFIAKASIFTMGGGVNSDTAGASGIAYGYKSFNLIALGVYGNLKENIPYDLSDSIHTSCRFQTDSTCQGIGSVINFYSNIGNIILTKIDTTNKILSGTFVFNVPISNCDTLNITDGRFDIKYY